MLEIRCNHVRDRCVRVAKNGDPVAVRGRGCSQGGWCISLRPVKSPPAAVVLLELVHLACGHVGLLNQNQINCRVIELALKVVKPLISLAVVAAKATHI